VVGDQVSFHSTSTDPDGTLAAQDWDLDGDGAYDDASGGDATTSFAAPGTHHVALRVRDDSGAVHSISHSITVAQRPSDPDGTPPGASPPAIGRSDSAPPGFQASSLVFRDPARLSELLRLPHRLRLGDLGKGVRIVVNCPGPCRAQARAAISSKTARRFGLHGRVIARFSRRLGPGRQIVLLKASRRSLAHLRRARALRVGLRAVLKSNVGVSLGGLARTVAVRR
jgi:hypothetical protein